MAYFIALGVLAVLGIGAGLWLVHTDGYRRNPTDPRRVPPRSADRSGEPVASVPRRSPATAPVSVLRTTHRAV